MIRKSFIVAAVLMTGCATHRIQYYQLNSSPPQMHFAKDGPALTVGRLATVQALQDARIRYRKGPNEVGTYEYHRWSDPPGVMVQEALIHALQASGQYSSVGAARSSLEGEFLVRGKLLEFAEVDNPGMQSRVSLELNLYESKTGRILWSQVLTHDDPVNGTRIEDLAQSIDRDMNAILGQATEAIGASVKEHLVSSTSLGGASATAN